MTSRQLYEAILIELNKENAPNILLEDFNYFANKAINSYINKRYNIYDINQQTTDDLRVLKATAFLKPAKINKYDGISLAAGANYEVVLPSDYLHILNCICIYKVKKTYKCYNKDDTWRAAATRLTADAYSQVLDNFWNKPSYKRPYYYIHNVNLFITNPTNPVNDTDHGTTDVNSSQKLLIGFSHKIFDGNDSTSEPQNGNIIINCSAEDLKNELNSTYLEWDNGEWTASGKYKILYDYNSKTFYKVSYENVINFGPDKISDHIDPETVRWNKFEPSEKQLIREDNKYYYSSLEPNKIKSLGSDYWDNAILNTEDSKPLPSIEIGGITSSNVERAAKVRYGNVSEVRMEIRYGTDDSIFELKKVYIDYIKAPLHIRLTQEQLDYTEDRSQILEYPDYVCQEIVNELVHIIMENISDLRILTHPVVSQSIANPAQQLTEPVALQQPT